MDIPIAENGLTGVAIGAALGGLKPVFVHMRMDFLPMCMDQIINHAAKWYFMSGGKANVPLVIRSIIGRGWGSAAQHSQALHALFLSVPGLKIVMPATPYDAKGGLIASVNDGNPVLFVEHRWVYEYTGYVPKEMYSITLGKGVIRKQGEHVTVVALSLMLYEAIKAAKVLAEEGISVEVIDPVTIKPLDEQLIIDSVRKTGRLIIADVGSIQGGVGAEIAAVVSEKAFASLKAPILRIGLPDAPIPASAVLEEAYYPSSSDIIANVKKAMACNG
jgi:acetoin:2,6-dichlorophenolindophenol oxidoreductase subunit beta